MILKKVEKRILRSRAHRNRYIWHQYFHRRIAMVFTSKHFFAASNNEFVDIGWKRYFVFVLVPGFRTLESCTFNPWG